MIRYLRTHLGVKLFLSYFVVLFLGFLVLVVTMNYTSVAAFDRQIGTMAEFSGNGAGAGAQGTGRQEGKPQSDAELETRHEFRGRLLEEFQKAFRSSLGISVVAAGIAALLVSFLLSRGITTPIFAMTEASQRLAEGKYDERVAIHTENELGQLAQSFNIMADKLERVEEMRRQLIGDVAHELRTPLTAIKGTMEALEDGVLPASADTYRDVQREAERLSRLVDDLQELSRVEAKAYKLSLVPVPFGTPLQTVEKRFMPLFAAKNVRFELVLPDELPTVSVDEGRLIQIFTNLLNNALYYTPEKGKVVLRVERKVDQLLVSIEDTGIGIPPDELKHVFTRFYRIDKSRSRHAGGSGIGLTITKHLVEAHGGTIWVESEGKDRGSSFKFTLPV